MNIYIYGSDDFKKEIHKVLDRSNVKFRLDENGKIEDIASVQTLKLTIQESPRDIYLIDNDKIIKKNILQNKIKFLKPKDGIEQEFLQEHGVGDIAVDSLEDIAKHIIKRLESLNLNDIFDEEGQEPEDKDIKSDDLGKDDIDISISNEELEEIDEIVSSINEFDGEENIGGIDDELSSLLSADIEEKITDEIEETDIAESMHKESDMSNEFNELDSLNEDDIMAALDDLGEMEPSEAAPIQKSEQTVPKAESLQSLEVDLAGANTNELAALINQLLNNKTLEITIKVKN